MKKIESVYEASPGANKRLFWMGYSVEKRGNLIKIEGQSPMTMHEARAFMHKIVDNGADDLVRRFGF
jgi:hypothetical protein